MSLVDEIASAFIELEGVHSKSIVYSSTSIPCHAASANARSPMESVGFLPEGDVVFYVRATHFSQDPAPNELVTFEGIIYRIAQCGKSHGGATYTLNCVRSENQSGASTYAFFVDEAGNNIVTEDGDNILF